MADPRPPNQKPAPASSLRQESCSRRVAANGATARLFGTWWTASRAPAADCHPEQAFFAPRGIWASRAMRRVLCDALIARLARFLIKTDYYSSAHAKQINQIFTISPSSCNIPQASWNHHVALLTGRVQGQLRGLRAVLIFSLDLPRIT